MNVLWFGAAVLFFGIMPQWSLGWIVAPRHKKAPLLSTVEASLRFLGGMNLGMAALSGMLLSALRAEDPLFTRGAERRIFFYGFAVGHFSQFFMNIPGLLTRGCGNKKPEPRIVSLIRQVSRRISVGEIEIPVWPEPDLEMLIVFIVDFCMFALNLWCGIHSVGS